MSATTHTKGPLIIGIGGGGGDMTLENLGGGLRSIIARANDGWLCPEHGGSVEGNMRLFRAAPDLLAALESLMDWGRDHISPEHEPEAHQILVRAHYAIAAARGENGGGK